jgi:hypothetical protein
MEFEVYCEETKEFISEFKTIGSFILMIDNEHDASDKLFMRDEMSS